MKNRVTMSDIAKELRVSAVTVSRALAGKGGVGAKLEERIRGQAERMGYTYNSLPRSMLTGRYYNIGILIGERYVCGPGSFYHVFLIELLSVLKKRKYAGIPEIVSGGEESSLVPPAFVQANKVDGLIVLGQMADDYLSMILKRVPRLVFLDFYSGIEGCDCIVSNNFFASYSLTRLLIAKGHRKIGFVGSVSGTSSILDRYMGFCKAMMEADLPYEEAISDRDSQGYWLENICLEPSKYTAYVCNSDQLAGNVIQRLREQGLKVPEDISIAGFDNTFAGLTSGVAVTSVEINVEAMCEAAVNAVIAHIEHEEYRPHGKVFIEARIIEKDSIAPPRSLRG
jgi:LacI family transcriptional regulator